MSVDFDRIAAAVSPDQLARVLGATKVGNGWRCPSPDHDDGDPSFSFFRDGGRTAGKCHGCGLGGSPVSLAAAVWRMQPNDAAERLVRELGIHVGVNGNGMKPEIIATYDYTDEDGTLLYQVVRFGPKKDFRQRRPDGKGGWTWKLGDVRRVLYRLPRVVEAVALDRTIYVVEGEKDVRAIEDAGGVATCNPGGAGKWKAWCSDPLHGARVVTIVADRDEPGRAHARQVAAALEGVAMSAVIVEPKSGKDAADHLAAGFGLDDFVDVAKAADPDQDGVRLEDFYAYMPMHSYIFVPTRELWPASSVNARVPKQGKDAAATWLDRHRAVEQMTWAPGQDMVIADRLIAGGGWIERSGVTVFNLYRPPTIELGDASKAAPWLEHVSRVFPGEAEHLIRWLAHRVQRPHEKINHALVLVGPQGTGKDTMITGAIPAVGAWNVAEVSPGQLMGRFNGFIKSVILRVSEARDLGDTDRYRFYEHLKTYTAAPPDVLLIDEKNTREYAVPNVTGVVITSNHTDGIYLPPDDRRHFVAATDLTKGDFTAEYWNTIYEWYARQGYGHVAAYLAGLDLTDFDAKAPPPKTTAFWRVVDAGRAPEDAELADALDRLGGPDAVTLTMVARVADMGFSQWLQDRRNSRQTPHRMEDAGYVAVRNDGAKDGRWKVAGRNQVIYVRRELTIRDRIAAARTLTERTR